MSALVWDGMGRLDCLDSLEWRRLYHTMHVRAPRAVIQARWDLRRLERATRVTAVPRAVRRM
jgi:hypothetical protein